VSQPVHILVFQPDSQDAISLDLEIAKADISHHAIRSEVKHRIGTDVIMLFDAGLSRNLYAPPVMMEALEPFNTSGFIKARDVALSPLLQPWQRPGWFTQATQWIRDHLGQIQT
jgi:hypothetical protein